MYLRKDVVDFVTKMDKSLYDNVQDGIDESKSGILDLGNTKIDKTAISHQIEISDANMIHSSVVTNHLQYLINLLELKTQVVDYSSQVLINPNNSSLIKDLRTVICKKVGNRAYLHIVCTLNLSSVGNSGRINSLFTIPSEVAPNLSASVSNMFTGYGQIADSTFKLFPVWIDIRMETLSIDVLIDPANKNYYNSVFCVFQANWEVNP